MWDRNMKTDEGNRVIILSNYLYTCKIHSYWRQNLQTLDNL